MDRNTVLRWAFISILAFAFMKWGMPLITGKHDGPAQQLPAETYTNAPGFAPDTFDPPAPGQPAGTPAPAPAAEELCTVKGNRFVAELSSRGAAVTHFWLRDAQYAEGTERLRPLDDARSRALAFAPDAVPRRGGDDQLKYDRFPWKLEKLGTTGCKFTYEDDGVAIAKTISAGERPFELNVQTQVTNLSDAAKKHRFSIATYAFRMNKEVKGKLGRVSPFATDLQCARVNEVTRKQKTDFKDGWFREPLDDRYAAVTNSYFAQALVPSVGYAPNGSITGA